MYLNYFDDLNFHQEFYDLVVNNLIFIQKGKFSDLLDKSISILTYYQFGNITEFHISEFHGCIQQYL